MNKTIQTQKPKPILFIKRLRKYLLLVTLIILFILFFYFRLYDYLSYEALKTHSQTLMLWTKEHLIIVALVFSLIYIIAVAASFPGAVYLTILGGFLFGPILGTVLVVVSATIGAFIIFLAVQLALRDWISKKAAKWIKSMEKGFQKNAFSYLMILRLIPIFPFWLVNIVPALLGVKKSIYITATFLGIIPATFVYVLLGNGVNQILNTQHELNLKIIFDPYIILPLIGLAILIILPIVYKKIFQGKKHDN